MTRLGDTCELMNDKGIGGLPVIKNGNIQGIITERDILTLLKANTFFNQQ
jgi:CBS domain-containing protein